MHTYVLNLLMPWLGVVQFGNLLLHELLETDELVADMEAVDTDWAHDAACLAGQAHHL